jgi:asparagine synthase (glutamine-hydrolysing)
MQSFFGNWLDVVEDPLFSHLVRWDTTSRTKTFFSGELRGGIGDYSCYDDMKQHLPKSYASWDYLSKAQYLEMTVFLSNYLLSSQGDRVAMAHAVEARPPYLDHRIMDFMGRVHTHGRIKGLKEKYLLKEVFRNIVPARILNRQKHPYRAPIGPSLFKASNSLIEEYLSDRSLKDTGLFDPVKVKRLLFKLRMGNLGSETDNMAIIGILSSQIIHRQFISQFHGAAVPPSTPSFMTDRKTGRIDEDIYPSEERACSAQP